MPCLPRPPRPDDLYRLRIATEPRLSPDGASAVVTLQTVAPGFDGYRQALWLVPTDGSAPAAPADARREARSPPAVLAGRPDPRVPVGSADARRGGAGPRRRRRRGSRGRDPGPPAAARRRRGAPADRPAPRRRRRSSGRPTERDSSSRSASRGATLTEDARRRGRATGTSGPRAGHAAAIPTTGSSTASTTCSTARGSSTTGSIHLWLVDVATGRRHAA